MTTLTHRSWELGWSRNTGAQANKSGGSTDANFNLNNLKEGGLTLSSQPNTNSAGRRQRRSDYGSFRASERDTELLYLVGEQYALTLPQVARLIGRSVHTARALRDRWKRAGWVGSGKLAVDAPSFVWLTGRGAGVARSPYRAWLPNHGLALHIEAVTEIRLLLDDSLRLGEWECERSIARRHTQLSGRRDHLPDAILSTVDEQIAIEVELTLKNRTRLREIINETGSAYQRVWYFARPTLIPALQAIAAESAWQNINVYPHPPSPNDLARISGVIPGRRP